MAAGRANWRSFLLVSSLVFLSCASAQDETCTTGEKSMHEESCRKYYECEDGELVEKLCPSMLIVHPDTLECTTELPLCGGELGEWASWSACSATCGEGTMSRKHTCKTKHCIKPAAQTMACQSKIPCEPSMLGMWTPWMNWETKCSAPCGGGIQSRIRHCFSGTCIGVGTEERTCNEEPCPGTGPWDTWTAWGACSVQCGGGSQTRTRTCPSKSCTGSDTSSKNCNEAPCTALLLDWTGWGQCSRSCGGGLRVRIRGTEGESEMCNEDPCKIVSSWKEWGSWSTCSASCGVGSRTRARQCTGNDCDGLASEKDECYIEPCPGFWSAWRDWSLCSVTCGEGEQVRSRFCMGGPCKGTDTDKKPCNYGPCQIQVFWSTWMGWSSCSESCGQGKRTRMRVCITENCDNRLSEEKEDCVGTKCAVDGGWDNWTRWSICSQSCDGGSQSRKRACTNPQPAYGGLDCAGSATITQSCNTQPCTAALEDACSSNPCGNGATCVNTIPNGSFKCECPSGYSGRTCQTAAPVVCVNIGTTGCQNKAVGDYQCCASEQEQKCSQYCTCAPGGKQWVMPCPGNLVWNDYKKRCSWNSPTCS